MPTPHYRRHDNADHVPAIKDITSNYTTDEKDDTLNVQGSYDITLGTPEHNKYITVMQESGTSTITGTGYTGTVSAGNTLQLLWDGSKWAVLAASSTTSVVNSVFGRSGSVVAETGDYTAAQVTNAFDKNADDSDDITEGSTNKFYSDTLVSANPDVSANTSARHTHTNKTILDGTEESFTTSIKDDITDNTTDRHTHTNKTILDGTEESFTTSIKDDITDNTTDRHTHANKAVLDGTEESFTTVLKNKLETIHGVDGLGAGTAWIDPGYGNNTTAQINNEALPFQTMQAAVTALEAAGYPGYMLYINPGTYNAAETVTINAYAVIYNERGSTIEGYTFVNNGHLYIAQGTYNNCVLQGSGNTTITIMAVWTNDSPVHHTNTAVLYLSAGSRIEALAAVEFDCSVSIADALNTIRGIGNITFNAGTGGLYRDPIRNTITSLADPTQDSDAATKGFVDTGLAAKLDASEKGAADGVAELDSSGKVLASQLPSYVDDVEEYADFASLPATGESGKLYVTTDDNKVYRWSGSQYVEIASSLTLGETSSTAYRGDRGKTAYDHSQLVTGNPHQLGVSDIESGTLSDLNGIISDATLDDASSARTPLAHAVSHKAGGSDAVQLDELAAPSDNTNLNASTSAHGLLPKLSGLSTDALKGDGSWGPVASSGGGLEWEEASSNTQAEDGKGYLADASSNSVTITAPASPSEGQSFGVKAIDVSNTLIVDGNGENIMGDTALEVDIEGAGMTFVYSAVKGWVNVTEVSGDSGGTTDPLAIHVGEPGEITGIPVKSAPGGADVIVLEDSADSSKKASAALSTLPVSTAVQTALNSKLDASEKGAADGVAELDSNGLVTSSQLPSYVDDVLEYSDFASLPAAGEDGKIYITTDDNKQYRWSGSQYVEISSSLALGETSSTAYRGDRGKTAYDHSQLVTGNPHQVKVSELGSGTLAELNGIVSDATLDDSSASRTPTAHAASHKTGGADAIALDELAAPSDNTNLDATASAHGLLPKLSGNSTDALKGDGTWGPVSSSGGGGGLTWTAATSNTQAVDKYGYLVDASSNAVTITAPANPSEGQSFGVKALDIANPITVDGNGENVEGSSTLNIDIEGAGMTFVYSATDGWVNVTEVSGAAASNVVENIGFSEIKTNRDFEESPGSWRPIYRKTIDFGAGPNASIKDVNHNISDISKITHFSILSDNQTTDQICNIPYYSSGDWGVEANVSRSLIHTNANQDWSDCNFTVFLEYTKTTDTATSSPRFT